MIVVSAPAPLLPSKAVIAQPFRLIGRQVFLLTFFVFQFNFLVLVWHLVLAFVSATELTELDVQGVGLESLTFVLTLQNYLVELIEPVKRIYRTTSPFF